MGLLTTTDARVALVNIKTMFVTIRTITSHLTITTTTTIQRKTLTPVTTVTGSTQLTLTTVFTKAAIHIVLIAITLYLLSVINVPRVTTTMEQAIVIVRKIIINVLACNSDTYAKYQDCIYCTSS